MKNTMTWLITLVAIVGLTLLREYSTNSTLDVLIGIAAYTYFSLSVLIGVLMVLVSLWYRDDPAKLISMNPKMKTQLTFQFYARSILSPVIILGLFIHVEWTEIAVLYVMSYVLIHLGASIMRDIFNKHKEEAQ